MQNVEKKPWMRGNTAFFSGIAMHDGWKPYDMFTDCRHVLCNAHLLRDLQGIIDSTGENGQNKCRDF